MTRIDTIVAAATPPGRGGIGIVRVSGPKAPELAATLLGELPQPRRATFARFLDAARQPIDAGLALFFPAPHSYTGEHVLELHGHGGPVVLEALIERALALGARRAQPGEFTQRAFLNDKLDLAQAEAIADLIDAGSREAARAAMRSLQGEFSAMVRGLTEAVIELRTYVEAAIDFPEEEVDFLADRELGERFEAVRTHFEGILESARQGRLLREGMTVVIAGRPNAGKSSLLNALARSERAIVTALPGTTRDLLREGIHLEGIALTLVDTAGLRESADVIEQEGMRRARSELAQADVILLVTDSAHAAEDLQLVQGRAETATLIVVHNKIDLSGEPARAESVSTKEIHAWLSAQRGDGLAQLRTELKRLAGFGDAAQGTFSARARHVNALQQTARHLSAATVALREQRAGELAAEELRQAQRTLGEITGDFSNDDLLGAIFSTFCIGK